MKSNRINPIKRYSSLKQVLAMVLVYIITLGVMFCFIGYAYCGWHRNNYFRLLEMYARDFTDNDLSKATNRDRVLFFDPKGEVVYSFGDENFLLMKEDPGQLAKKFLPAVFEGKNISEFVWWIPKKEGYGISTSAAFYGVPVAVDSEIRYTAILIKETPDTLEVATGFLIIITLFFGVIVTIMLVHGRRLQKYEAAQKQYIDNVTHELKSPVASVRALAQALSDGKTVEGLDESFYYGKIMTETDKQEKLINNILELSKMQNNADIFDIRKVAADEIFAPVFEKYSGMCNLMDIDFNVSDTVRSITELNTDPVYMRRLLDIFLSNAVKFADRENGAVSVDAEIGKKKITMCVSDNGIGISEKDLPHIFDRFYRADNAGAYAGSGLGLSMAKEIANGLKEKIWIESADGAGTKVYFTLSV